MKLSNVIKRIEKATGEKFKKNGTQYYMKVNDCTVDFFENGEGSGSVRFITVNNDIFFRTIKGVIESIGCENGPKEVEKTEVIEVIETKEDHQEIIEETKTKPLEIKTEIIDGKKFYTTENKGVSYVLYKDFSCDSEWCLTCRRKALGMYNPGTTRYFETLEDIEKELKFFDGISLLICEEPESNTKNDKQNKSIKETKADNIDHDSFLYVADKVNEIEELNEQDELTKPIESDYKTSNEYLKALQEWREETGNYNQYEQKQEARADRFEERAEKAEERSNRAYNQSKQISDMIPFGQPILVGHHSEKRARKDHERINNNMRKSIEESDKAKYYENKAENARNNHSISSDDDDAVIKLKTKIETAKDSQEKMKAINKAVKKKDIAKGDTDLKKMGYNDKQIKDIRTPDFMGRIGFAGYQLANNNANIKRMEKRLETLEKQASDETTEIEFDGGTIIDNVEENRLQIDFDEKPSEEIRTELKRSGFRWARSFGVWQRFRSPQAMWIAKDIVNCC